MCQKTGTTAKRLVNDLAKFETEVFKKTFVTSLQENGQKVPRHSAEKTPLSQTEVC